MNTYQEHYERGEIINVTNKLLTLNNEIKYEIIEFNNSNFQVLCKYQDNTYSLNKVKYGLFYNIIENLYYLFFYIEEKSERNYLFDYNSIIQINLIKDTRIQNFDSKRLFLNFLVDTPKENLNIFNLDFTKFDNKIFIKKDYIFWSNTGTIYNPFEYEDEVLQN